MNILENIICNKLQEIDQRKKLKSINELKSSLNFNKACCSLKKILQEGETSGIIAEFKRKSPSKGIINNNVNIIEVTNAYKQFGAAAISVLTDQEFFGGSLEDLALVSDLNIPLLRKDFIIDEYQLFEARSYGATIILLIAACLTPLQVKQLSRQAKILGLEVLLEIHNKNEIDHICEDVDLIGINNRNLKTFDVSIQTSLELIRYIPANKIAVAESGISEVQTIVTLKKAGFHGFLIGEKFMKNENPSIAFSDFAIKLKAAYES